METKKALKIVGIVTASALTLLITAVVVLPKIINKRQEVKDDETKLDNTGGGGSGGGVPTKTANPIGNIADIKKFQDWMDLKHPNWLDNGKSLNKGFGYGNYGSQTTKAWGKYSSEYGTQVTVIPPKAPLKVYSKIANNIIKNDVNDSINNPFNWSNMHRAGNSELLGITKGVIKKDFDGVPYLEIYAISNQNIKTYALLTLVKYSD